MRSSPSHVATLNGMSVKEKSPSPASASSFPRPYLVAPVARAGRSYGSARWRKPAHARRPRTNTRCSGMAVITSTTRRSIRQKSPASRGIATSEDARRTR